MLVVNLLLIMAFFGQEERDEMNAEEAQIQVTGGGEGEGEEEGYIESEPSAPNRVLNATAQSVIVCRQKKNMKKRLYMIILIWMIGILDM